MRAISAATSAARLPKFSGQFSAQTSSCCVVGGERREVPGPLVGRCRVVVGRPRERAIEMVLGHLEERRRRPEERPRLRRRLEGGGVVARVEARLQLADPVPARGDRQARIALEVLLEPALVELGVVEGARIRRQAPERPDEPELSGDDVDDEAEPRLPRERRARSRLLAAPRRADRPRRGGA